MFTLCNYAEPDPTVEIIALLKIQKAIKNGEK